MNPSLTTTITHDQKRTFNSGYSLVVTHLTTNPPVRCLNRAERTGSLVLNVLWSNVKVFNDQFLIVLQINLSIPRFNTGPPLPLPLPNPISPGPLTHNTHTHTPLTIASLSTYLT
jgi:hypothetical protein